MDSLCALCYSEQEAKEMRAEVYKRWLPAQGNIRSNSVCQPTAEDIRHLFFLYDEIFFKGGFKDNYKGVIKFSLSSRMTRSAGKTLFNKKVNKKKSEELVVEIRIAEFIMQNFNETGKEKSVCGIKISSPLEALQLVLEHEICHVIEFLAYQETYCSRGRYKKLAQKIFAHVDTKHKLPTNKQIALETFGLKAGDNVAFIYKDKRMTGVLSNITKRATVFVRDKEGIYCDSEGNRYNKFYVPLESLIF